MDFLSDTQLIALIQACRAGDDAAFSQLFSHYTPLLHSITRKIDTEDADAFAEACIGLYKAVMSFDTEQSSVTFGLYARICITRRLSDYLRARGVREDRLSDLDVDSIAVPGGIEARLVRMEESMELRSRARALLSEYEYRVFLMWLQGYKTGAIAQELAVEAKSVDNAKARITKKLRDGFKSADRG